MLLLYLIYASGTVILVASFAMVVTCTTVCVRKNRKKSGTQRLPTSRRAPSQDLIQFSEGSLESSHSSGGKKRNRSSYAYQELLDGSSSRLGFDSFLSVETGHQKEFRLADGMHDMPPEGTSTSKWLSVQRGGLGGTICKGEEIDLEDRLQALSRLHSPVTISGTLSEVRPEQDRSGPSNKSRCSRFVREQFCGAGGIQTDPAAGWYGGRNAKSTKCASSDSSTVSSRGTRQLRPAPARFEDAANDKTATHPADITARGSKEDFKGITDSEAEADHPAVLDRSQLADASDAPGVHGSRTAQGPGSRTAQGPNQAPKDDRFLSLLQMFGGGMKRNVAVQTDSTNGSGGPRPTSRDDELRQVVVVAPKRDQTVQTLGLSSDGSSSTDVGVAASEPAERKRRGSFRSEDRRNGVAQTNRRRPASEAGDRGGGRVGCSERSDFCRCCRGMDCPAELPCPPEPTPKHPCSVCDRGCHRSANATERVGGSTAVGNRLEDAGASRHVPRVDWERRCRNPCPGDQCFREEGRPPREDWLPDPNESPRRTAYLPTLVQQDQSTRPRSYPDDVRRLIRADSEGYHPRADLEGYHPGLEHYWCDQRRWR